MHIKKNTLLSLFFIISSFAHAQNPTPSGPPFGPPPTQGPYTHRIETASSDDGMNWTLDHHIIAEHASVPATIIDPDGTIRTYFVDASKGPEQLGCLTSTDLGKTFVRQNCVIEGRTKPVSVDFSPIRLPDGTYRLYYYGFEHGQLLAKGDHAIYVATSADGKYFEEFGKVFAHEGLVDPDVFYNGKEWIMYVCGRNGTEIARSTDGLNFSYFGPMQPIGYGTTAPIHLSDGRLRLYAFTQSDMKTVVSFISNDGLNWQKEEGIRLKAENGREMTDPFVVHLPNGKWLMTIKTSSEEHGHPQPGQKPQFAPAPE